MQMSSGLNIRVHVRRFACGVINCHQKFVSASAVARHAARMHHTDDSSNGKACIVISIVFVLNFVSILFYIGN